MQAYSNRNKARQRHALPDIWITDLTAREHAEQLEETIYEYMRRPEFKLAAMNSATREAMFDAMIEEEGITGGYFWCFCQVGCMPDSSFNGPFKTVRAAHADMRRNCAEY